MVWNWLTDHFTVLLGNLGVIGSLLFAGWQFRTDARVRRAQTLIEFTKLHRELWERYDDHPELFGLFEKERDLGSRPLSDAEMRFANSLFLHIRASFDVQRAGIYVQPEKVREDIRDIFSFPALRSAWPALKDFQDRDFIAFIENCLKA